MHKHIRNILCILIGVVGFNAVPAQAQLDMFLCLKKGGELLKGESQSARHKDCIDVLAWSWGASQSGTTHMGGGGGAGIANFQDISLTKYVDPSSPELLGLIASGEHLGELILYGYKAGCAECGSWPTYLLEVKAEVLTTSYSTGGSGGENRLTENVTFNFPKYKYCYTPQEMDGSILEANAICTTWDIQANTP